MKQPLRFMPRAWPAHKSGALKRRSAGQNAIIFKRLKLSIIIILLLLPVS